MKILSYIRFSVGVLSETRSSSDYAEQEELKEELSALYIIAKNARSTSKT